MEKAEIEEMLRAYENSKNIRISIVGNIVTGILVSMMIIFIEGFNKTVALFIDLGFWIYTIDVLILGALLAFFWKDLKDMYSGIFKPKICAPNMVATISKPPEIIKSEGQELSVFAIEDAIYLDKNKNVDESKPKKGRFMRLITGP